MPVSDARGCGSLSPKLYIFRCISGYRVHAQELGDVGQESSLGVLLQAYLVENFFVSSTSSRLGLNS